MQHMNLKIQLIKCGAGEVFAVQVFCNLMGQSGISIYHRLWIDTRRFVLTRKRTCSEMDLVAKTDFLP